MHGWNKKRNRSTAQVLHLQIEVAGILDLYNDLRWLDE
jgi:hypothetical protein